jgi:hypothetical protein
MIRIGALQQNINIIADVVFIYALKMDKTKQYKKL